ncbi:glycoside hydrolase, partial [Microthyrium microscopicum]
DDSLLWGPYRPNLYFGIRPRISKSLSLGLMWIKNVDSKPDFEKLRHTCEQSDGMAEYGWSMYDPRTGGVQTISDPGNNIDLTTEFVKITDGSQKGSWGTRVRGSFRDASHSSNVSLIWYIFMESDDTKSKPNTLECQKGAGPAGVECHGYSHGLDSFTIQSPPVRTGDAAFLNVQGLRIPDNQLWMAKENFVKIHKASRPNSLASHQTENNVYYVEHMFSRDFEFDILFTPSQSQKTMSANALTEALKQANSTSLARFDAAFRPKSPFDGAQYSKFSQSLLSNLLGGIGFFSGSSLIDTSDQSKYEEEAIKTSTHSVNEHTKPELGKPVELFSSVPSRPVFPRGFLWDEGFHQLLILEWDLDLSIEMLQSWLSVMDERGWIAREFILGPEARSKVPYEFQIMYPNHANPPTLFLAAQAITQIFSKERPYHGRASKYLKNKNLADQVLDEIFFKLNKQYSWFRDSQKGNASSAQSADVYRWRGRTSQHILASGLDDYPRPQPPSLLELHVDAASWVDLMATVLRDMARSLGRTDSRVFEDQRVTIKASLDSIHWSPESRAYCDAVPSGTGFSQVCHLGYVSLMPFLLGLLDHDDPKVGDMLDLIRDEKKLWSPHGLQSLSKSDEFYGKDENYWRGPIWININFLAIQRLLDISQKEGPYQARARMIYSELRRNVVSTVYESWKITGYAWEQYNQDTGAGQRTQHFTGWTALVVKIMAFPDL